MLVQPLNSLIIEVKVHAVPLELPIAVVTDALVLYSKVKLIKRKISQGVGVVYLQVHYRI